MRTTLTLDPDVAVELQRLQAARKQAFKETVNTVLRAGIAALREPRPRGAPGYRTEPVSLGSPRVTNLDDISEVLAVAEGEDHR